MEQDKVLHSMAKFDLQAPTNVKIVLEDFSDEDSQDKQNKNDLLKLDPNDKQNKEPSDNNPNGHALKHVKVNKSECFIINSVRATNSTEIRNNNLIYGNGSIEDEKGKTSEDDFKKAWSSIEELLMSASKHLIIIIKAYNEYSKFKDSRESKEVMNARNKYLFIKHLSFKFIYHVIISVLLPEEKNSGFINDFINNTLKIANKIPDISCTHSQLEMIYRELLEWAKQKQTLESNKKKTSNIQNVTQGIAESNLPLLNFNKEINPEISRQFESNTVYENNVLAESSYNQISLNIDSVLHNDEKLKAPNNGTSSEIQEKSKKFPLSSEPQISDERVARPENFRDKNNITTFVSNGVSSYSASQTFTHKENLSKDKNIHIIESKESIQTNSDHINHKLPINSWYFTPGKNNTPCQNIVSKGIEKKLQHQNTLFELLNTTSEKQNHSQNHETFVYSPQQLNIHNNNCQTSNCYQLNYPPSTVPVQQTCKTNFVLQKEKSNTSLNRYSIEKNLNHIYNNSNQYPASKNILNTETISNEQLLQHKYPELTRHIHSNAIHFENHFNLPGSFPTISYNYNNHNYNNQSINQINESNTRQHRSEGRNFFQPYSHRPPCTNRQHIIQSGPPPSYSDTLQKRRAASNIRAAVMHLEPSISRPNHATMELPTIPQTPFENDGSVVDDRTRSTSTDSGFVSPLNTTITPENFNYTSIESCSPLITHVTSLNPNAAQNCTGLCHVCRKETKTKCLGCYKFYYCSVHCQDTDWPYHMQQCEYFKSATK